MKHHASDSLIAGLFSITHEHVDRSPQRRSERSQTCLRVTHVQIPRGRTYLPVVLSPPAKDRSSHPPPFAVCFAARMPSQYRRGYDGDVGLLSFVRLVLSRRIVGLAGTMAPLFQRSCIILTLLSFNCAVQGVYKVSYRGAGLPRFNL